MGDRVTNSYMRSKPGAKSAEAGTCMDDYPPWICPRLPLEYEALGKAQEPHVLRDDDADGIEAELRREAKLRRFKIPTL